MKKIALIIGVAGQDGTLLSSKLELLNYIVVGISKGDIDLLDSKKISKLILKVRPDEIYYLAAYHNSSQDKIDDEVELFKQSIDINAIAVNNFLNAIFNHKKKCRFFYASSCLIFQGSKNNVLSENSPYFPESYYAISKIAGGSLVNHFRNNKNIFACSGILFNHESSLRTENFLSKKITSFIARLDHSSKEKLSLGGLDMTIDWGYAPDYVDAFWRILQTEYPDDYIVATGIKNTIKDFLEIAFEHVNLDYRDYVKVDPSMLNRKNTMRIGSPEKLKKNTGWKPSVNFEEMVKKLVDIELIDNQQIRS